MKAQNSQLSFFSSNEKEPKKPSADGRIWHLYVDGASRNNPGPAGAGICLKLEDVVIEKIGYYLGQKTNNQAEYLAMVLGVVTALEHVEHGDTLAIHADSELLIRQMTGKYRIKNPELKVLAKAAEQMLTDTAHSYTHVRREFNSEADSQANKGVDSKRRVPDATKLKLREFGVIL